MLSSRRPTLYPALIGVAVGALLTGLVLPMTIDAEEDQPVAGREDAAPRTGLDMASDIEPDGGLTDDHASPEGGETRVGTAGEVASEARSGAGPASGVDAPTVGSAELSTGEAVPAAPEVGVSPSEMRVGVLLFDTGNAGDLGFGVPGSSTQDQRRWYESFIADVNEAGGIHGRKVVPTFISYDVLDLEDQRRACVAMAEDVNPFLVLGYAFSGDPALCLTERYQIPLLGWLSGVDESYRRSRGRWVTTSMSSTAMAKTQARRSHEQGHLRGATIGVLMNDGPDSRPSAELGLVPELKALGYEIAHSTTLSADLSTAQTQIPVAISEMRRKGVDKIVSVAGGVHMGLWWNQAEGQNYRPLYLLSDVQATGGDFGGQSAPQSVQAIAYTSYRHNEHVAGLPEQPESKACRDGYQQRTGESIDRSRGSAYANFVQHCGLFELFVRGVDAAGPGLTRSGLLDALAGSGRFVSPGFGGSISFRPGKPDGADFVRTKRYQPDCRCFAPIDDFVQSR